MIRAALLLVMLSCTLPAQATAPTPGHRVRLHGAAGQRYVGLLLAPVGDSVFIERRRGGYARRSVDTVRAATSAMIRLDVSRGMRTYPARGLLVGALAGIVVGAGLGTRVQNDNAVAIPTLAVLGGAVGGVTGLVVGLITPGERWERVIPAGEARR